MDVAQGEMVGEPRLDPLPCLLFEADVQGRKVQVDGETCGEELAELASGRVGSWEVSDLTRQRVTEELLAIARRAAN